MTTRAELIQQIRDISLIEADDFTDDKLGKFLDRGVKETHATMNWPYAYTNDTITTVADTETYTPATVVRVNAVAMADAKVSLHEVVYKTLLDRYGAHGQFPTSDIYTHYYILDAAGTDGRPAVGVFPTPATGKADDITVYGWKGPTLLANDGDEPDWTSGFHELLVDYGLWKLLQREEQYTRANQHRDAFFYLLGQMKRWYVQFTTKTPWAMGVSSAGAGVHVPYPWLYG